VKSWSSVAVQGLILLYNLSLVTWFVLRWWGGDRFWWLWMGNALTPFFFLPLLLFLPSIVVRRRWLAGLLIPAALFVLLYGSLFLPRWPRASASRSTESIRLMTYNILFANPDYAAVARVVSRESPDIVALEELSPPAANTLVAAIGDDYPYRALEPRDGPYGLGIFSRLPLVDWRIVVERPWGVGGLAATAVTPCGPLQLLAMHTVPTVPRVSLTLNPGEVSRTMRERRGEIQQALAYLEPRPAPTVLFGDFNLTDQNETYRLIADRYTDGFREAGWGFGFTFPVVRGEIPLLRQPYRWPVLRIDYVFHSPELYAQDARVGKDSGGSDHRPLVVDLVRSCDNRGGH